MMVPAYFTRRDQIDALRRLIMSTGVGLMARLRNGEAMPALSDVLSVIADDYRAEVGAPLVDTRGVEALVLALLIARPQPGFRELARYYLTL